MKRSRSRLVATGGHKGDEKDRKRLSGWLKEINSLSLSSLPPSHSSEKTKRRPPDNEKPEFDLIRSDKLPDDMIVRKSLLIEANFDLRPCINVLQSRQNGLKTEKLSNMWIFEAQSMYSNNNSRMSHQKSNILGDMLWLRDKASSSSAPIAAEGDKSARTCIISWQEALCCLSDRYFQHQTARFYIHGYGTNAFRACFYRVYDTENISDKDKKYECIIHQCTMGIFEDLRSMGVPLKILQPTKPGKPSNDALLSFKEQESLNIFSGYVRKNRSSTTDKMIHLSGKIATRALLDSIRKYFLPIASMNYVRIATELPTILSTTEFRHASISSCIPVSYSCHADNEDSDAVAAEKFDSFRNKYLGNIFRKSLLQLNGYFPSNLIQEIAGLVKDCAQLQHNKSLCISASSSDDINSNVFKIDDSKLKATEDSDGYTTLNPFRITSSNPEKESLEKIREAQSRFDEKRLLHRQLRESDKPFFKIKLISSLSEYDFSYWQNLSEICHRSTLSSKCVFNDCRNVVGGRVSTDMCWDNSDDELGTFEIKIYKMPTLQTSEVLFDPNM